MEMKKYSRVIALVLAMTLMLVGCGESAPAGGEGTKPSVTVPTTPPVVTPQIEAPEAAKDAGYTSLVFYDDFDDPSTVDWEGTGEPGYKWYIDRPFGWESLQDGDVVIEESIATIAPQKSCANWGISTYSAKGDTGAAWTYAYFEARIRINTDITKDDLTEKGQPAFWSFSKDHTLRRDEGRWGEIDFFEVTFEADGTFNNTLVTSMHDSRVVDGKQENLSNTNNIHPYLVSDDWQTIGCLWTPGSVSWYLDGGFISRTTYSADGMPDPASSTNQEVGCFSILDQEEMLVVLGSGPCWPMEVDWVRVWQAEK